MYKKPDVYAIHGENYDINTSKLFHDFIMTTNIKGRHRKRAEKL